MNDPDFSIRRRDHVYDPDPLPASTRPETPLARGSRRLDDFFDGVSAHEPREMYAVVANLKNAQVAATATIAGGDPTKAKQAAIAKLAADFAGPYAAEGQTVRAPVMFRMSQSNSAEVARNAKDLAAACARCRPPIDPNWIRSGQASAKQVVAVTQALIDAGKLPSGPGDLANRIRTMQWRFGVGADCASFTRQAFVRVTGKSMSSVGLNDYGEAFRGLDWNPHFKKVGVTDVRPGDIITLDPRGIETIGHNVIVADHRIVDPTEQHALESKYGAVATKFFAEHPGPIHAIVVDSSWGAGDGDTTIGGERRERWMTDGKGNWAHVDPRDRFEAWAGGPAENDSFHGAYRLRGR